MNGPAALVMRHHSARHAARVIVRETPRSTEWIPATLYTYGGVGDMGCVAFTVDTADGRRLVVAEDRIHLAECVWCQAPLTPTTDPRNTVVGIMFERSTCCDDPEHQGR